MALKIEGTKIPGENIGVKYLRRSGAADKAELYKGRAMYMGARTERGKFLIPLLISAAVIFFIIGPSITIILNIIAGMNPLIWIGGLLFILLIWRRYVA